jgi:hypothetical protein
MATTKGTAVVAPLPTDLDETLTFNGKTYNINAKHSISANSAGTANSAGKLSTHAGDISAGDTNTPVYFKNGVPHACKELDLNTTGNAATATTAVTATTAAKVNNSLKIHEYSNCDSTAEPVEKNFTGESEQDIHIVPATGGSFHGPVTISVAASEYTTPELAILNRGQIGDMIQALTGSPFFTWDGSVLTAQTAADGNTMLKVDTIVGTEDHYDTLRTSDHQPEAYLYICTDGYNTIYFNAPGYTDKKLVLGNVEVEQLTDGISENATYIRNIVSGAQPVGKANKADSIKVGEAYKDGAYFQKKITVSPSNPSGGIDGDIWIKY